MVRDDRSWIQTALYLACAVSLAILSGCAGLHGRQARHELVPGEFTFCHEQLTIHSDFFLPADNRLIQSLAVEADDLNSWFGIATTERLIHVYLFEDGTAFKRYVTRYHEGAPFQRAFFSDTGESLEVYAVWGLHGPQDLRHELAHAYLHAVIPDIPLWIDEGIAEYSELPSHEDGLHREFITLLAHARDNGGWLPDIRRLERWSPQRKLGQLDYAEAWLWTHFLMESRPEYRQLLRDHLRRLADAAEASDTESVEEVHPFELRLRGVSQSPETELLAHLKQLENRLRR